jgi:uncharacterized protein
MRGVDWIVVPVAVWLLAASGCGTTPPSSFYTLSPLPGAAGRAAPTGGSIGIGLGPVSFPAFLDRPQIVSRDSANRLQIDELRRWGGTIQDDFMRVLSENLSYLLGTSHIVVFPTEVRAPLDFRVSADVLTFEGTTQGQAELKVRWAILDPFLEQALSVHETAYREPVQGARDQAALVAAMSAALGSFSRDVAAAIKALPKPVQAPKTGPLY